MTQVSEQAINANDQWLVAKVELGCRDWIDNGRRHTECRIKLWWTEGEIEETDWNFFEAFKRVRERLALYNLLPMCYGASRKVLLSGMLIDIGLGLEVYKVAESGQPYPETVYIFDNGDDVEPVSVQVQGRFQNEWTRAALQELE
jgi:hypothetical protein